ncbi:MAG TPA: ABC transporter ATP-binding protein [Opitutaceae bacterium]|nr:ABC transporter ATP-binding protein [Opitutaceae bacterium]
MSARLEAVNLSCGYDGHPVFKGVDFSVRSGEVCALIGPNGSGKTTLLHALDRLVRPMEGEVRLDGVSIWNCGPREVAARVALAPQRAATAIWPLSVRETIQLARAPHRGWLASYTSEDVKVVMQAMERFGLVGLAGRSMATLSGGEVRRVLLARALAQAPAVLLFDEPLTYLDLHYQAEILTLVRTLSREEGIAVVLTLHDLALAALCADRVVLLANGRICGRGPPADILTPEFLRPVYGEDLEVIRHPGNGVPIVLPRARVR